MMRVKSFMICDSPIASSIIEEQIDNAKRKLIERFKSLVSEKDIYELISLIEGTTKNNVMQLEGHGLCSWDKKLYPVVYEMVSKIHVGYVAKILQINNSKFIDSPMPLNYLLKIVQSGIEKQKRIEKEVESDLEAIRSEFLSMQNDVQKIAQIIPSRFLQLTLKVNRNSKLDQESKKSIIQIINEAQKKVQKWITARKK